MNVDVDPGYINFHDTLRGLAATAIDNRDVRLYYLCYSLLVGPSYLVVTTVLLRRGVFRVGLANIP